MSRKSAERALYGLASYDSRKLSTVFTIDSFGKSIDSFDGIIDRFYIKNANVNAPLQKKKKNVFPLFSQRMILSSKKRLYEELFETSIPIKMVIFIFVIRRPLPFKRHLDLRNSFPPFSPKKQFFIGKTVK